MRHMQTHALVDGYQAGEVDFAVRLAAAGEAVQQAVDDEIMRPLVDTLSHGDQGAFLLVFGHADRIDDPSLSHAACLQREQASLARAQSTLGGTLRMLGDDFEPPPADWGSLPAISAVGSDNGAANPIAPGSTEADALRNRRVSLYVTRFTPDE